MRSKHHSSCYHSGIFNDCVSACHSNALSVPAASWPVADFATTKRLLHRG